mgnify:CR=1 FL=1
MSKLDELKRLHQAVPYPWLVERGNVGANHPLFMGIDDDHDGIRLWTDDATKLAAAARNALPAMLRCAEAAKQYLRARHPDARELREALAELEGK